MSRYKPYIDNLKTHFSLFFKKKNVKEEMENRLSEHGITRGMIQKYYNKPELMYDADVREVALIGHEIAKYYPEAEELDLKSSGIFTDNEVKDILTYAVFEESETVELPLVLENVSLLADGSYMFPLDYKLIAKLYKGQILNYNFEVQRQPKYIKRKDQIIRKATVNERSVEEIKGHLLKQTLVPTNVVYNAALGTGDGGEELIYDSKERTLTILEGTRLDILDGMHRTLGSLRAYNENKQLTFNFVGLIFNYSTRQAQAYQAQQAKANPIPKSRIAELEANRYADAVVQYLRTESELKDHITSRDTIGSGTGELVSYGTLSNAIDATFELKRKLDAIQLGKYLSDYFMYLFGYFGEDEINPRENLLFNNKMFIGHIVLAKRLQESEIPVEKLDVILGDLDFSRKSKLLKKYEIINEHGNLTSNEKNIAKLFKNIKIEEKQPQI